MKKFKNEKDWISYNDYYGNNHYEVITYWRDGVVKTEKRHIITNEKL